MKKNYISIVLLVVFAALTFSSCLTTSYEIRGLGIDDQPVISSPTLVDVRVDMSKRIKYADQDFVKYSSSSMEQTEKMALAAAKYACITENNIDILVDPIYKIQFKGKKKAKIELTGLAGYYDNARSIYENVKEFQDFTLDDVKKYIIFNNPELLQTEGAPINITIPSTENK